VACDRTLCTNCSLDGWNASCRTSYTIIQVGIIKLARIFQTSVRRNIDGDRVCNRRWQMVINYKSKKFSFVTDPFNLSAAEKNLKYNVTLFFGSSLY
jgi:hypothetical protein